MAEKALSSLWSYDLDPRHNPAAMEASEAKCISCPVRSSDLPCSGSRPALIVERLETKVSTSGRKYRSLVAPVGVVANVVEHGGAAAYLPMTMLMQALLFFFPPGITSIEVPAILPAVRKSVSVHVSLLLLLCFFRFLFRFFLPVVLRICICCLYTTYLYMHEREEHLYIHLHLISYTYNSKRSSLLVMSV